MSNLYFHTTSAAAQKLGIPQNTLCAMLARKAVGPFSRDSAGRNLLDDKDVECVRQYIEGRKRVQGATE